MLWIAYIVYPIFLGKKIIGKNLLRKNITYIVPIVLGCFFFLFIQDFYDAWLRYSIIKEMEKKAHVQFSLYKLLYRVKHNSNEIAHLLEKQVTGWNISKEKDKIFYSLELALSGEKIDDYAYLISNIQKSCYPHIHLKRYAIQQIDSENWICTVIFEEKVNDFL